MQRSAEAVTMTVRRKAVLRIAICVLPDYCHHVHAQNIRIVLIIDVMGYFVNAAS
jgi:hypothetical protein